VFPAGNDQETARSADIEGPGVGHPTAAMEDFVPSAKRTLRVEFEEAETFQREYQSNLSNGGVFVRTEESFEAREAVEVELAFPYASRSLALAGEVVDIVPAGMAAVGGTAGVAVQFLMSVRDLRKRFAPLVDTATPAELGDGGNRGAPRKPVHVASQIQSERCVVSGRTRNLSLTGVLVEVSGAAPQPGDVVEVALTHPTTGECRTLAGRVARQIEASGELTAVAIQFTSEEIESEETVRFIEEVQGIEHTRRLGAITGPIDAIGPQAILQMFANSAPRGTLLLRHGQEEGVICFDQGLLLRSELGGKTGMKALIRMLSWRDGAFEFRASVEDCRVQGAPLPLEAALFDAVRQIDEGTTVEQSRFPLHARIVQMPGGDPDAYGGLSKVEAALIDLAHARFTVQRALEVIPEPDPEIFRALQSLADAGLVAIEP
jgi:uncharacterized protein (TIGR02266 family)